MNGNLLRWLLAPARAKRAQAIDASILENRILYSATPLALDGNLAVPADIEVEPEAMGPSPDGLQIDAGMEASDDLLVFDVDDIPLGDTVGEDVVISQVGSGVKSLSNLPSISDIRNQQVLEDATASIEFTIGDNDTALDSLSITASAADRDLVDRISIGGTGANRTLELTLGSDLFGETSIDVVVSDGTNSVTETFLLDVKGTNDAPEFLGFSSVNVTSEVDQTVIDLHAAFEDAEDADSQLTFQVVDNSNESLFSSITIDHESGRLILDHADGRTGTADLTIVATDRGGLSTGWAPDEDFHVFDQLKGEVGVYSPDAEAIGLTQYNLWTDWFFFEKVNGRYDYSHVDEEKFISYLHDPTWADPNVTHVFNIEVEGYDNTELGRDRFAYIFDIANRERPDLDFGLYAFVPERDWYAPVDYHRALEDQADGLTSYYTNGFERIEAAYLDWQARNELYRTDQVSAASGGGTFASKLGSINPSLYTFYFENTPQYSPNYEATLDADSNTFTAHDVSFEDVQKMGIRLSSNATLRNGLSPYVQYHVVNVEGDTFQISESANGPAIDFGGEFSGDIFVQALEYTDWGLHDRTMRDWQVYAEESIAEARKFDEPVYAWISPSMKGTGVGTLDYDFFRKQLDILRPISDGIVVYEPILQSAEFHEQQEWWTALQDFMATLDDDGATLNISVSEALPQNTAPVAANDAWQLNEDQSIILSASQLLANDRDAENDSLSLNLTANPRNGSLEYVGSNQWRYTPNDNFYGSDSFTYRLNDGEANSNVATVALTILPVNDLPVAGQDSFSLAEDTDLTVTLSQLLRNDTDVESDHLTASLVNGPSHGSVVRTQDGSFVYTPTDNYSGRDTFTYRLNDGQGNSNVAMVELNIAEVNDVPLASNDSFSTANDQPLDINISHLLQNDGDIDGDGLEFELIGQPSNGSLSEQPNGSLRYEADQGFTGTERIAYRVFDGKAYASAEIVIQVQPGAGPAAPVTVDDRFSTSTDDLLVFRAEDLIANDDMDGSDGFELQIVAEPTNGSIIRTESDVFFYITDGNFSGEDQFQYRLVRDGVASNISTVVVDVNAAAPEPEPPVPDPAPDPDPELGQSDSFQTQQDQPLLIRFHDLTANDNSQGNARIRITSLPLHGSVVIDNDSVEYFPGNDFTGVDHFTYRIHDGNEVVDGIRVEINVTERSGETPSERPSPIPPSRFGGTSVTPMVRRAGAFDGITDDEERGALRPPRD